MCVCVLGVGSGGKDKWWSAVRLGCMFTLVVHCGFGGVGGVGGELLFAWLYIDGLKLLCG